MVALGNQCPERLLRSIMNRAAPHFYSPSSVLIPSREFGHTVKVNIPWGKILKHKSTNGYKFSDDSLMPQLDWDVGHYLPAFWESVSSLSFSPFAWLLS